MNRVVFSNWHLTLNSNLPDSRNNRARFTRALRSGLQHAQNHIFDWLRVNDNGLFRRVNAQERAEVLRSRMRVGLEHAGAQNASPHAHILLEVTHRLNIRVDYDAMRRSIYDGMRRVMNRADVNGQNFHADFVPPQDVQNVLYYIGKDGPQQATDPALRQANWGNVHVRTQAGEVFNPAYAGGSNTADMDRAGVPYVEGQDL